MPGYSTRNLLLHVGGHPWQLRVLSDTRQYADPDGHGERLGISPAQWSLFGRAWPSGQRLARALQGFRFDAGRSSDDGGDASSGSGLAPYYRRAVRSA